MAKKRQPTREEIEQEAAAELNRSMRRSLPPSSSGYSTPMAPETPSAWGQDPGPSRGSAGAGSWVTDGLSSSEEEETVTELAIQQMAERWGGKGSLEDHVISRVNPTDAEDARDRALRQAMANQARFAKPARRIQVPQSSSGGFAGSWTSSPTANTSKRMVWESALPTRDLSSRGAAEEPPDERAPARPRAKAEKASPKRAAPAKKAPAKKTAARKTAARKAPAEKASPKRAAAAKKTAVKKAPAAKKAAVKKAPAAKKAAVKRAPAAKKTARRAAPARKRAGR
ncbi:MAG TPA: hypothetical protein VGR26_07030 [Acidimicrobiales bacterium]|nr:hypothetical protein [Acidimicrobiales bacterium]